MQCELQLLRCTCACEWVQQCVDMYYVRVIETHALFFVVVYAAIQVILMNCETKYIKNLLCIED